MEVFAAYFLAVNFPAFLRPVTTCRQGDEEQARKSVAGKWKSSPPIFLPSIFLPSLRPVKPCRQGNEEQARKSVAGKWKSSPPIFLPSIFLPSLRPVLPRLLQRKGLTAAFVEGPDGIRSSTT